MSANVSTIVTSAPTWHGIEQYSGGLFERGTLTPVEAARKGDMLYQVQKVPAIYEWEENGKKFRMRDSDRFALIRPATSWDSKPKRLRIVSRKYRPIQNETICKMVEGLGDVETVAVLKGGEIFFVLMEQPPFYIGSQESEKHRTFYLVADDKKGGGVYIGTTHVRVVCQNTFTLASRDVLRIPHYNSVEEELDFRVQLQRHLLHKQEEEVEALNRMFKRNLSKADVDEVLKNVYPLPQPSRRMVLVKEFGEFVAEEGEEHPVVTKATDDEYIYNLAVERQIRRQEDVKNRLERITDENPSMSLAYALFQSVTEQTNHSDLFTGNGEKRFVSKLFGQVAKVNKLAFEEISKRI